jgi:hypothetical protein
VDALTITIRVPWQDPHNTDFMWNELLAWTCETYGLLSGDNWSYRPDTNYMDFHFYNENDAMMFQLKTAGQRIEKYQHTIEFVADLINQ